MPPAKRTAVTVGLLILFSASFARAAECTKSLPSPLVVTVPGALRQVKFSDDCEFIYATNWATNAVEVFSLRTGRLKSPIAVGSAPLGFDSTPDGSTLYVANSGGANISVVDIAQGREVRKIQIPNPGRNDADMPHSIAVDRNGKIFVSTKPNGLGCMAVRLWPDISCSSASGSSPIYEIDPVTYIARDRRVFFANQETFLKASADRGTIVGVTGGNSGGPVHVYSAATGSFRTVNLNAFLSAVAVDATGSLFLISNSFGSFVLDGNLNTVGRVQGLERSSAPVIDSNRRIGYQVGIEGIYVVDLSNISRGGILSAGDGLEQAIHGGNNYAALSPDGTLIAVVSNHGFSIVRTDGGQGGPFPDVDEPPTSTETPSVIAYSSKSADGQSVFRFYNGSAFSGRVRLTISDLTTGEALAEWDSPYLSPGTSGQFSVQSFEESAGPDFVPPPRYVVRIRSEVDGTFTHVLWDRNSTIINLPTCDTGAVNSQRLIANIYPSALDHAQPSSLVVFNLASGANPVTLGIYSADTGDKLGTYLSEAIKPGTGKVLPIYAVEVGAGIPREKASSHHIVKIEGEFSGYIQHFQYDPRVNIIGDMTPACRLVGSSK